MTSIRLSAAALLCLGMTACGGNDDATPISETAPTAAGSVTTGVDSSGGNGGDGASDAAAPSSTDGGATTVAPPSGPSVGLEIDGALEHAVLAGGVVIGIGGTNDDRRALAVDPASGATVGELSLAPWTNDQFDGVRHIVATDEVAVLVFSSDFGQPKTLVVAVPELTLIGEHDGGPVSVAVELADGIAAQTGADVSVFDPVSGDVVRQFPIEGTLAVGSPEFVAADGFDGLTAYDAEGAVLGDPVASEILARPRYVVADDVVGFWSDNGCTVRFMGTAGPSADDAEVSFGDDCNVQDVAIVDGVATVGTKGLTSSDATHFVDVASGEVTGTLERSYRAVTRVGSSVVGTGDDGVDLIDPASRTVTWTKDLPAADAVAVDDDTAHVIGFGSITTVEATAEAG